MIISLLLCALCGAQDFVFTTKAPPLPKPLYGQADTISLMFMGDMMMHTKQIETARVDSSDIFDFSTYFTGIRHLMDEADLTVANAEFTLGGKPYSGYPSFSAPDAYADYIADSGVDIFLTANNHILDKGARGIERTLGIYDKMEAEGRIHHTGSAMDEEADSLRNPLIVPVKGIRIALVNFTYGTNASVSGAYPKVFRTDTAAIRRAIEIAQRKGAKYIIALPHWGTEYNLKHSGAEEKLAEWLAENGCDAIIGTHPHVVQDVMPVRIAGKEGRIKEVPVVYSLGNLISNMSATNTQIGMIATLRIAIDRSGGHSLLSPDLTMTWCSRPGNLTDSYTTVPVREFPHADC